MQQDHEVADILVVEDSRAQRLLLCAILAGDGHAVCEARDGLEGEAAARGRRFDLVITDFEMPGLDGMELTRRLRDLDDYRTAPILIMSARADLDAKLSGLATGANDYLVKPLAQAEVVARVRSLLQLGRSRRALEQSNRKLREALDELQRCQTRLVAGEKLAYAGRLASGIAHECNSPLQALIMTLPALQMDAEILVEAIPPAARASGEVGVVCAEMPEILATCTSMVERLAQTVGRFGKIEGVSAEDAPAHTQDLRATVEGAIDAAGVRERVRATLPAAAVPLTLAHHEAQGHLATLFAHICSQHAGSQIAVRLSARPARLEVSARGAGGPAELLGRDFSESNGRVQFDLSVSTAREALLRMGVQVEIAGGPDGLATLVITFPPEP